MKQVILLHPGTIELRDVPVPEPSEGEVTVKVNTALTCGTDVKAYARGHTLIPMPGPFGHEYSGTIALTGKGVTGFKEGDHVMGVHSAPCSACRYCQKGLYNLCESIMGEKALGSFAEYLRLPSSVVRHNLFHKPDRLGFEEAALLEPLSCIVHPYKTLMPLHASPTLSNGGIGEFPREIETALILGAGPVGLMHLVYLKARDIQVIVSEHVDARRSLANTLGAFRTTAPRDLEESIQQATGNAGVDLVIECTGQQSVWEQTVNHVRRGGTIVLFGGCPAGTNVTYSAHRLHYDELTLMGSFHYTPADVKTARQLLVEPSLDLSLLISGSFPLEEMETALLLLKEGKGIKYAIHPR